MAVLKTGADYLARFNRKGARQTRGSQRFAPIAKNLALRDNFSLQRCRNYLAGRNFIVLNTISIA
jgi:hypothetical protein